MPATTIPQTTGFRRDPPRFFLQASPESPVTPAPSVSPMTGWKAPSSTHVLPSHRGSTSCATGPIEQLDALIEIHRALYRGREEMEERGEALEWEIQEKELKRVIDRWFEGDCIYDHPLARVSSRQSLLAHFALLNLLSTMYLPTLTPISLIQHVRGVFSSLQTRLMGERKSMDRALATASDEEVLGLKSTGDDTRNVNWWKLYDVSADCKEIGAMETYDGYHLAMIEQVISLTFFPSLLPRDKDDLSCTSTSTSITGFLTPSSLSLPSPSFSRRLSLAILREISDVLRWDIPLCTTVHFNEVGKATHIRDSIDVRDVIETFVPFAMRINWLSRRLTGVLTSTLGAIALGAVNRVVVGENTSRNITDKSEKSGLEKDTQEIIEKSSNVHSTTPHLPLPRHTTTRTQTGNLLGLGGVDNLSSIPHTAPDVDRWA